jgi:hypothetical protein
MNTYREHKGAGLGWSTRWHLCATSRMVAGSIPGGASGIFYWHNSSGRTMALGLTQSPTEINTRNTS